MARHHPPMAARVAIVVMMIACLAIPTAALFPESREGKTTRDRSLRRALLSEWSLLEGLKASAPAEVRSSAGADEDENSHLAAFDADTPAEADPVSGEKTTPSINETLVVSAGGNETAGANATSENATVPPLAAAVKGNDTTALVISNADPVRQVKAKVKTGVADANVTEAEAPGVAETDDGDGDAPKPSPELSLDEEKSAEAPKEGRTNSTANASAPAPAVAPANETSAEAPESGPGESAPKTPEATNATNATDAVSDEDDAGVVLSETAKKHNKEDLADVEEENSVTAPASETKDATASVLPGFKEPAPTPEQAKEEATKKDAPPPPVSGTVSTYALGDDVRKGTRAEIAEDDSEDDALPSRWEAATGAFRENDAVAVEVAVHPEGGESQFERALPIVLGGCVLGVVVIVVQNRMRGAKRAGKTGKSKRGGAAKADWNRDWSDKEGWSDSTRGSGKNRGSPISAQKWAAEEPAWSDDEDTARDGDGWR